MSQSTLLESAQRNGIHVIRRIKEKNTDPDIDQIAEKIRSEFDQIL